MAEQPQSFSFVYQEVRNKPTLAVTGAYGGASPDGLSVVAHLFVEYGSLPAVVVHEVGEGGRIDLTTGEPVKRGDVTREVQATMVLSPGAALALATFLRDKAETALRNQEDNKKLNS